MSTHNKQANKQNKRNLSTISPNERGSPITLREKVIYN